jgi:hypothetical protein
MEIDNNLVSGNMACFNNVPAVQFGDSGAAPNIVAGWASGECGFGVVLTTPAPEAMEGPGIQEHISVPARSLKTYYGTYTSTTVTSLPPVLTESGDTLLAQLGDFTLSGGGLKGSGTYNSSLPPGSSGQAFVATTYPDGSTSFTVYDTCVCSFHGQTGTITLRAYGRTTATGFTSGTFLVTSGGPFVSGPSGPGPSTGGLATLSGWGTFSSWQQPAGSLGVIEHLRIT